ncbi:helix-turn-helix transcriptional regulator [Catenulispora pinisilvae]|uniref:helix-turn-helix transcriptional regulator n=1 Tax=Catenulispora pinisilvae TaxID=2705253 RepID=UPI00189249A7|nr:helix-turn-helix transcriptional regulator [Catenulispora pinisilvae]
MTLDRRAELGEFLRSRRARLNPADVGLPDYGGRRRVPGLRREESALLAGVSVDHYVRLEQGRALQFSEEVLDAVARALKLDPTEREHLYRLARPGQSQVYQGTGKREPQWVRPGLQRLLESTTDVPAYVVGLGTDVLAWNELAAALLTDFGVLEPHERNLAWLLCHTEHFSGLFQDPAAKMADIAAYLRFDLGRHPDDPALGTLIGQLCRNPDFAEVWARHDVRDKTHGSYTYRNPVVGEITLEYETFRAPDDPDQALILHTVPEGSSSEAALRLLAA